MSEIAQFMAPSFQGLSLSTMTYTSASRSTSCDIMCTSNTEIVYKVPRKSTVTDVTAVLPYESSKSLSTFMEKRPLGSTMVEKYRHATSQEKRNAALKKEKRLFFDKMEKERKFMARKRDASATRIQSHFRGYLVRRPTSYVRKRENDWLINPNRMVQDIQEDLCALSEMLDLKPIVGLSLNNHGKKSKRRMRIEQAACIRIQSFFRMIIARSHVENIRRNALQKRMYHASKIIKKFFKWVMKQRQSGELITSRRQRSAVKIQTRLRIFLARERIREMKKVAAVQSRRMEACYKIAFFIRRAQMKWKASKRRQIKASQRL